MHEAIQRDRLPMVVAVMLANGRPHMVERAVASFEAQSYKNKHLLVLDTGDEAAPYMGDYDDVTHHWCDLSLQSWPIGKLRNEAIRRAPKSELICHWDSDDWSHPLRIEEQVAAIASSKKECVGYRDLLFWDNRSCNLPGCQDPTPHGRYGNGAFRFTSQDARYLVGASMMYTVDAWVRYPFNETMAKYEDQDWWAHNNHRTAGCSSFKDQNGYDDPRIICAIHDSNTSDSYRPEKMLPPMWKRVPEWDRYCFGRMV